MLLIQYDYGFIIPSKVRKMDCQDTNHIGILYNLVQRMSMESTFGMLKSILKILLKKVDSPLSHMLDLVMVCICLHNMCIIDSSGFDMDWALEVQRYAQIEANTTFGNLKGDE